MDSRECTKVLSVFKFYKFAINKKAGGSHVGIETNVNVSWIFSCDKRIPGKISILMLRRSLIRRSEVYDQ